MPTDIKDEYTSDISRFFVDIYTRKDIVEHFMLKNKNTSVIFDILWHNTNVVLMGLEVIAKELVLRLVNR